MGANTATLGKMRNTVGNAIARASVKFELKDGSDGANLLIEN